MFFRQITINVTRSARDYVIRNKTLLRGQTEFLHCFDFKCTSNRNSSKIDITNRSDFVYIRKQSLGSPIFCSIVDSFSTVRCDSCNVILLHSHIFFAHLSDNYRSRSISMLLGIRTILL